VLGILHIIFFPEHFDDLSVQLDFTILKLLGLAECSLSLDFSAQVFAQNLPINSSCSATSHILIIPGFSQPGISSVSSLSFSVSTIDCWHEGTLQVSGQNFVILAPNSEFLHSFSMPNPVQNALSLQELAKVELKKLVKIKLVIEDLAIIFFLENKKTILHLFRGVQ